MLAAKSAMFAKSLLSRPAAFQVPSQRVLSTAANLKVDGNQDKQVDLYFNFKQLNNLKEKI